MSSDPTSVIVPPSASPPAIVITGPTGVGKTGLALEVAARIRAEVVSVDSRQLYVGMDIGTAKPTRAQRAAAAHHLLDLVSPTETCSAGQFAGSARDALGRLEDRNTPALLVGGSGLYLSAILDGLFSGPPVPAEVRQALRQRRDAEGLDALWQELGCLDPAAQRALNPNDDVRILRSLELALADRRSRSDRWSGAREAGLRARPLMFALTRHRDELYRRIDARAESMVAAGWVAEVGGLLAAGLPRDAPGLDTLGYGDILAHLLDGVSLDETLATIRRRTRQYAKRQMTWFRRDRRLCWLDLDRLDPLTATDRIVARWQAVQARRRLASAPVQQEVGHPADRVDSAS